MLLVRALADPSAEAWSCVNGYYSMRSGSNVAAGPQTEWFADPALNAIVVEYTDGALAAETSGTLVR
jgi:hypothetical protein